MGIILREELWPGLGLRGVWGPVPRSGTSRSREVTPAVAQSCPRVPALQGRVLLLPHSQRTLRRMPTVPRMPPGKGKHSPPSGLRTDRKSSLRISSWSPRSCRDKDRQVGAVQSPASPWQLPELVFHPRRCHRVVRAALAHKPMAGVGWTLGDSPG